MNCKNPQKKIPNLKRDHHHKLHSTLHYSHPITYRNRMLMSTSTPTRHRICHNLLFLSSIPIPFESHLTQIPSHPNPISPKSHPTLIPSTNIRLLKKKRQHIMPRNAPTFLPVPCLPISRFPCRRVYRTLTSAIDGPDGLPNARDLATASPKITSGKLFRGATPASLPPRPNPEALRFLRTTHTFLDLRSKDERRSDHVDNIIRYCGHDFPLRERHIGLLNKRKVVWGLARVLPREQVTQLAMRVVSNPLGARQGIVHRMDQGGLILLNRILVEASARQIGRAMNLVTDGVDEGKVYFYCSAGKDRTGLLAALILKVLGVSECDIIKDYVRSSDTWQNGPYELRADYCARLEHAGLTPLNWLGAPPEVMESTLDYIKRQYGSVEDYLIRCGYGEDQMRRLQEAMEPS